jgi:hypothetical protein
VNPEDYIFFFNLRSYDRLNVTPSIKKQEEKSGVSYQEVQQAEAQEIMGNEIEGQKQTYHDGVTGHPQEPGHDNSGNEEKKRDTDAIRKFEAHREDQDNRKPASKDRFAPPSSPAALFFALTHLASPKTPCSANPDSPQKRGKAATKTKPTFGSKRNSTSTANYLSSMTASRSAAARISTIARK